ncbi:hypothetical protein HY310_02970, partial [Candidatus Microgenomates bacterium]|nr:hypothetical protein [Candidatus Microgenomates bacterium]
MKKVFAQIKGLFNKKMADVPSPMESMTAQEKNDANQKLSKAIFYVLCCVIFLFPVFFVPVLANWFDLPKATLLLAGVLVAAILWLVQGGMSKKFSIARSPFDIPALAFVVVSVVSAALTVNKVMNLSGDPVVYCGGFLLFFLLSQLVNKGNKVMSVVNAVLASVTVLSVWSLVQQLGIFTKVNFSLFNQVFNPTGAYLAQAMLLAAVLPLALGAYLKTKKGLNAVFLAVTAASLVVSVFVLYKNPPVLLNVESGWKVSTGTMGKSLTSAIFGVGPANYVDAFTLYKPAEFNTTKYWNMRFTGGANFYFYLLSTMGIAGLAALVLLISKLVIISKKHLELPTTDVLEKGLIGSLG